MRSTPEFAYLRRGLGQDTCAGQRLRARFPVRGRRHFPQSQSRHREGLAFLGNSFSDLRGVLTPAADHSQQGRGQTGNLNRPLIVLTSSSRINMVDLVKLPKHQPSLIRPLARCYGCQPGVMPTHNLME